MPVVVEVRGDGPRVVTIPCIRTPPSPSATAPQDLCQNLLVIDIAILAC
jgi:hypothetical protein